jgi:hypothetical protein
VTLKIEAICVLYTPEVTRVDTQAVRILAAIGAGIPRDQYYRSDTSSK